MNTKRQFQNLGIVALESGPGEEAIQRLLSHAKKAGVSLRFLRLAAPRRFRKELIQFTTPKGMLTRRVRQLLAAEIPTVEFILANPTGEAFLARMDSEGKDNRDIWRVKTELLTFALGLLRVGELRKGKRLQGISVGFHRRELLWNLGILGERFVAARTYRPVGTGHDPEASGLFLETGHLGGLAESLIGFYQATKADDETMFVTHESELRSLGHWPSLFKSNAIYEHRQKLVSHAVKLTDSSSRRDTEAGWLHALGSVAGVCQNFRPPPLIKARFRTSHTWEGEAFSEHFIHGVDGGNLLSTFANLWREEHGLRPKLKVAVGQLIEQAFGALHEFHACVESMSSSVKVSGSPYPWEDKLCRALQETKRFIYPSHELFQTSIREVQQMAHELMTEARIPFRDANIKNRLFAFGSDPVTESVRRWLVDTAANQIGDRLREKSHDVDFETCRWLVTEWDDPFHLLGCPFVDLQATPSFRRRENMELLQAWWRRPTRNADTALMHTTFLCRSLREFLRRLWYANVMPRRYLIRYGREPRDHFLFLARMYAAQVQSCTALEELLDDCWERREQLWNGVIENTSKPALVVGPIVNRPVSAALNLSVVRTGRPSAAHYQQNAVSVLRKVFAGALEYVNTEVDLHEGRKRVDAVFSNIAVSGFFHELRLKVKCDYVFVECKNYSAMIGNRELDQLAGRFAPQRGKFGILCCRNVENRKQIIQLCQDAWNDDRGCIIVLDDSDLAKLGQLARSHDRTAIDAHLKSLFYQVTL